MKEDSQHTLRFALACGGTKRLSPFPLSSLLLADEKPFAVMRIKLGGGKKQKKQKNPSLKQAVL